MDNQRPASYYSPLVDLGGNDIDKQINQDSHDNTPQPVLSPELEQLVIHHDRDNIPQHEVSSELTQLRTDSNHDIIPQPVHGSAQHVEHENHDLIPQPTNPLELAQHAVDQPTQNEPSLSPLTDDDMPSDDPFSEEYIDRQPKPDTPSYERVGNAGGITI